MSAWQGPVGKVGPHGDLGAKGEVGPQGLKGEPGAPGKQGEQVSEAFMFYLSTYKARMHVCMLLHLMNKYFDE